MKADLRPALRRTFWTGHLLHREQRAADGQWEAICSCGWKSDPKPTRDALGWECPQTPREEPER